MTGFTAIHLNAAMQELMFRGLALVRPPKGVVTDAASQAREFAALDTLAQHAEELLGRSSLPATAIDDVRAEAKLLHPAGGAAPSTEEAGMGLAQMAVTFAEQHGAQLDEGIFSEAHDLLRVPYASMDTAQRDALADLGAATQIHETYPAFDLVSWKWDPVVKAFPGASAVRDGSVAGNADAMAKLDRIRQQALSEA